MAVPFFGASSVYRNEKSILSYVAVFENAVGNGGQPSGSGSKNISAVAVAVVVVDVVVVAAVSSAAAAAAAAIVVDCVVDKVDVQVVVHRGRFDGRLYDVGKRL